MSIPSSVQLTTSCLGLKTVPMHHGSFYTRVPRKPQTGNSLGQITSVLSAADFSWSLFHTGNDEGVGGWGEDGMMIGRWEGGRSMGA